MSTIRLVLTCSAGHVYLLPGAAGRRLEDDQPQRDSVVSRMTLVLVP
jgi:hypothetical protein